MLYIDEESKGEDLATHTEYSLIEQVSPSCKGDWEIFEFDHERIPYFKGESTFEEKEYMGEGCSPIVEGEDLRIDDNYCNTPTCFKNSLLLR